jgi:predicted transposase YbfD/YdcC
VEVITDTLTRKGKRSVRRHLFLTSVRTTPEALLRLIRQRWSIENERHWARDAQLGEDAHPRFQERCHPFDPSIRGLEDMTNAPIQRGR